MRGRLGWPRRCSCCSPSLAPSADVGAPLLRSVLFIAAPGNHDIADRDLDKNPDGLAYFYYWTQPLNGLGLPEMLTGVNPSV